MSGDKLAVLLMLVFLAGAGLVQWLGFRFERARWRAKLTAAQYALHTNADGRLITALERGTLRLGREWSFPDDDGTRGNYWSLAVTDSTVEVEGRSIREAMQRLDDALQSNVQQLQQRHDELIGL